jgi:hypothetical protein
MKIQEERIKIFESTVKNTRFEQLSASSDIGQGIIMGYTQALEDNKEKKYTEEDIINALHSVELKDNKDYSKIYNGMKEWFEQFKKK